MGQRRQQRRFGPGLLPDDSIDEAGALTAHARAVWPGQFGRIPVELSRVFDSTRIFCGTSPARSKAAA